jgi:hypothetical protein
MIQIDERTKSIVLQAEDPFSLRELLPKSKILSHPDFNFAAKHDLQSTMILRNMGYPVPSPIRYQYGWPGKFIPFDHQISMADFWTVNRRAFNLSEAGCVSADTEYLSPTGWRRIDTYAGGPVAQYWPESGEIEFVEPMEYVKLPCENMIRFKTKYGVDQLLSPEHRVLLADGRVVSAMHVLAHHRSQSLEARSHKFRTTFKVRGRVGLPFPDPLIRVQVAANADGWFPARGKRCYVRLKRPRKIARMRELLIQAGLAYWERPCLPEGFVKFSFEPPMRKGFDQLWWSATQQQLELIADEMTHWDGHACKASAVGFSGTRQDADFIQYALSASGMRASISQDHRSTDLWSIHASRTHTTPGVLMGRGATQPNVRVEPSPDGFKYCFMVPSTFLLLRRNGCIVATGNTGKTNGVLWAADYLMSQGHIDSALIIAPLSTIRTIWMQDIFDTLMHRRGVVVHGTRDQRRAALRSHADFYLLNHDGVKILEIMRMIRDDPTINLVVVDEGDEFRNHDTAKYKALAAMIRPDMRIWWQTGTPIPNDPTDAWAQARIINPDATPKHFGTFKRETMMQLTPFKWVPKKGSQDRAFQLLQPAIRFKKKDCLDLPPVVVTSRQSQLTAAQRAAFDTMKANMVMESADAIAHGGQIAAVHAADQIGKLRQILCGCVKEPKTNNYVEIDHGPRIHTLLECIRSASAKVIVIVPFKGITESLATELGKHYSVGLLNGDVSANKRHETVQAFKHTPDPHILLCHPKVMSHGLNLTEADTTIFYAPIYSNSQYQQVIERFNRAGQKNKMTVYKIAAHPMEWEIYRQTELAIATQESILSLYNSLLH